MNPETQTQPKAMQFDFSNLGIDDLLQIGQQAQEKAVEIAKENGKSKIDLEEIYNRIETLDDSNANRVEDIYMINAKLLRLENQETAIKYLQINEQKPINIQGQHANFETLLISIKLGLNVMLVGEAGSGKTTGAHNVATALNMNFASISVGAQTGKHEFFGYKDANGNFVETDFYHAYKNGGVFLIDELDAGNAGVLTSINSALANGVCSFACGMVEKNENFICIATANTYGNGATLEFIGRNAIDGATLDRFTVIDWNIDENLEAQISKDSALCLEVQTIRKAVKKLGLKHIVSTRGLLNVEKLIGAGMERETAFKIAIWKGLSLDAVQQIKNNL